VKKLTLPSDIKGKGALSAFAELIDPLCNLAEDEDTREMYMQKQRPEGRDTRTYIVSLLYKVLAKHQDDFCRVMAVCYGTTPEKYAESLSYVTALQDWAALTGDEVWKSFFLQAQAGAMRAGSAQANTPESQA
jgi:hypothetical protein